MENCSLRPDPGPCRGRLPRYYFLPRCNKILLFQNLIRFSRTSKCIQFPWGGCGGNANNFISASQCQATCLTPTNAQAKPVPAAVQEHPLIKVSQDFLGRKSISHVSQCYICLSEGRGGILQRVTWNQRQGLVTRDSPGPPSYYLSFPKITFKDFLSITSDNFLSRWYFSQGKCQR